MGEGNQTALTSIGCPAHNLWPEGLVHAPTTQESRQHATEGETGLSTSRRPMFGEQQRFMLLLVAPAALLLTLFQVVPIVIGANASFRNWALYNPKKTWVGLDHYYGVLSDPAFLYVVLPNTF